MGFTSSYTIYSETNIVGAVWKIPDVYRRAFTAKRRPFVMAMTMHMHLLNLPPEIINSILSYLSPPDLLSCQLTTKYFNSTILNSIGIQYDRALTLACAVDSPFTYRPIAERIRSLKATEGAWETMVEDFVVKSEVPLKESGVYDLTGGVYLLSSADRMGLGYTRLPSKEGEIPVWEMISVGKMVVDIGLCVYEHDLMAIVTSTVHDRRTGEPNTFDINIELIELSTKKPHTLARNPIIHVMNSSWEKPSVGIEIVGKHLVLVLSFSVRERPQDRIFIYEWQTGNTIASFEARSHTYSSVLFLDEHHFLLPNTRTNALDIYRIPSAPTLAHLEPILILALPALTDGRILGSLSCRAEPNPISKDSYACMRTRRRQSMPGNTPTFGPTAPAGGVEDTPLDLFPQRDFLLESLTALCMFELRIHVLIFHHIIGAGLQMGFPFRYSFTFVAPRSALLELIASNPVNPELEHASATPLSSESVESKDAKSPAGGTGPLPSTESHVAPTRPPSVPMRNTPAGTPSSVDLAKPDSLPAPPKLTYDAWGPACTRWFGSNEYDVSTRWITTSAGGRCVRMPAPRAAGNPWDRGERFYVHDFNESSVKAEKERQRRMAEEAQKERRQHDQKGKGRADGEGGGCGIDGEDRDSDDDAGAPRPDKGKGKARMDDLEDKSLHAQRKKNHQAGPSGNHHMLFGIPGLYVEDDDGQLDEDEEDDENDIDTNIFENSRDHEWTVTLEYDDEHHGFGLGGGNVGGGYGLRSDDDGGDVQPQSESDLAMEMFLAHHMDETEALGEQEAELGDEDEDADKDEDEAHNHGDQTEISNHDHNRDEMHDIANHLENLPELEEPDLDLPDFELNREEWTLDPLPCSTETLVISEPVALDCPEVFVHPVHHSLPCVIRASRMRHQWAGVLLDEESVIGIVSDSMIGHVKAIEIHHFG